LSQVGAARRSAYDEHGTFGSGEITEANRAACLEYVSLPKRHYEIVVTEIRDRR
jgi:hypothetical protein